jgi:predicted signal transduction protein with EAL and GGDEF domain
MVMNVLIKNADIAMYCSKESGRNSYSFFTQEMNHEYQKKMVLEKALRKALHSNYSVTGNDNFVHN